MARGRGGVVELAKKRGRRPRGVKGWGALGWELRCVQVLGDGRLRCRWEGGVVTLTRKAWRSLPEF